nr:MAG: replication associated protein [Cressdnaviricota sp.]
MSAICVYDFTLHNETDENKVKDLLKEWCKKWTFQEEEGEETKRLHMQGRFSLKVAERMSGVIKKFPGFHLSITSKENHDNMFYVSKEETRKRGPWSDKDKEIYIPRQIREIKTLYPWQEKIVNDENIWNPRTINVVIDTVGNNGKSILKTYVGVHGVGRALPFSNDFRDIMRMVMDTETKRLYIIDIPRALRKDQMYQFFAGIESLKDGYAFDDRYSFKEKYFDCPNIWIFMNIIPEREYLSKDRWRFWQISAGKTLEILET